MNILKTFAVTAVSIATSVTVASDFNIGSVGEEFRGRDRGRQGGRYVLQFYDQQYRGQNTLKLKRELQRQYGVSARGLHLERVRLVAKTKKGRGTAALRVGRSYSHAYTVMGRPRDFNNPNRRTFDRVNIYNDSYSSQGPWQIDLRGNFKVRKVVLVTSRRGGGGGGYGRRVHISCSSLSRLPMNCSVDGRIRSAYLVRQHSSSKCIEGRSWGYHGRTLWVDKGCRGTFEVVLN